MRQAARGARGWLALAAFIALLLLPMSHARAQGASGACPPVAQAPTAAQARSAERTARDRGFLWRATRNGRVSWLYGTMHLGRPDWLALGPTVRRALTSTDTLALELDLTDPAILQAVGAAIATGPGAQPLPPALEERLARQVAAACIPAQALQGQHPVIRAVTLMVLDARWDGLDPAFAQELALADAARAARLPVQSLETVAQQMAALLPADPAQALEMLGQTLGQLEDGSARRSNAHLARAWAEGRLEELEQYERWCECVTSDEDRAYLKRVNDDRNPGLAERIDALHSGGQRVFAAVGALHMTGPNALPLLMARRGYIVERVLFKR